MSATAVVRQPQPYAAAGAFAPGSRANRPPRAPEKFPKLTSNENARLIAAAPELLEACKAILDWADRECMPQGGKSDGPWEKAESAILKATEGGK